MKIFDRRMEFCELMNEIRVEMILQITLSFPMKLVSNIMKILMLIPSILELCQFLSRNYFKKSIIKKNFIVRFWKNLDVNYKNIEGEFSLKNWL